MASGPETSNTLELGKLLYTEYLYPLEIAAVILLVAIVGYWGFLRRRGWGTARALADGWRPEHGDAHRHQRAVQP